MLFQLFGNAQKISNRHVLDFGTCATIAAAMQAREVATQRTFPKQIFKFVQFRFHRHVFVMKIQRKLFSEIYIGRIFHKDKFMRTFANNPSGGQPIDIEKRRKSDEMYVQRHSDRIFLGL